MASITSVIAAEANVARSQIAMVSDNSSCTSSLAAPLDPSTCPYVFAPPTARGTKVSFVITYNVPGVNYTASVLRIGSSLRNPCYMSATLFKTAATYPFFLVTVVPPQIAMSPPMLRIPNLAGDRTVDSLSGATGRTNGIIASVVVGLSVPLLLMGQLAPGCA